MRASCVGQMLATVLVLTSVSVGLGKEATFSNEEKTSIETFVGDIMGCANIPGLALAVVREDATFVTGHGVANMETAHPTDGRTIFNLGSTAKAFVPYLLAEIMNGMENRDGSKSSPTLFLTKPFTHHHLCEELFALENVLFAIHSFPCKVITWNSTLRDILRSDPHIHVTPDWADMTLKDMLIYKSGTSAADMGIMVGLPHTMSREEVIRRLRFVPNTAEFRKSSHYSNIMYTIAGAIAEKMTGMSWENLVRIRVLDKQDMNTSAFAPEGMKHENAALPYRYDVNKTGEPFEGQNMVLFDLHPSQPVGALMASAEDITKWIRHILHNLRVKGNDSGVNMLIEDAFSQWVTTPDNMPAGTLKHSSEKDLGYGMGWIASNYRDFRRYKFSGRLYAYSSQIWLFPEALSAIFVVINGPGGDHVQQALDAIMYHISDITLHKNTWVNVTTCLRQKRSKINPDYYDAGEEDAPMEQKHFIYQAPVESYVGKYGNGLVGNLIIEANKTGGMTLSLGRNLKGKLLPAATESTLTLVTTSWLMNTDEWSSQKWLEFDKLHTEEGKREFLTVRVYVNDKLSYEFVRGQSFEMLLLEAEEERNKMEAAKMQTVQTPEERTDNSEDRNDNFVMSEITSVKNNAHLEHLPASTERSMPGSHENHDFDPDSHQSHQPYNIEGENEHSAHSQNENEKKGHKIKDKFISTSKPGNDSSHHQIWSLLIFFTAFLGLLLANT